MATPKTQTRSLESRRAVLRGVVDLIAERGFSACTTANIAAQAGVSWGVLQYQFGGKREIFEAVLQQATDDLKETLLELESQDLTGEGYLQQTLNTIWGHYSSSSYRAAMEVLLNYSHEAKDFLQIASGAVGMLHAAFKKVFKELGSKLSAPEAQALADLALASLRGLAIGNAIVPSAASGYKRQRAMLQEIIVQRCKGQG